MRYDFNQKVLYKAYREKYVSKDERKTQEMENSHPYIDI